MATISDISGQRVLITWLRGDAAYGRDDCDYTAVAICVDGIGTLTFRRDEDGFLGIAGAGSWEVIS